MIFKVIDPSLAVLPVDKLTEQLLHLSDTMFFFLPQTLFASLCIFLNSSGNSLLFIHTHLFYQTMYYMNYSYIKTLI